MCGRQIINNVLSNENHLCNSDYPQLITEELWNAVQKKKNNSGYSMRYTQNKSMVSIFEFNESFVFLP